MDYRSCLGDNLVNCPAVKVDQFYRLAAWMDKQGEDMCLQWSPRKPVLDCHTQAMSCLRPVIDQVFSNGVYSSETCT